MKQLVYASLLLIITLRFSCGERKICSTIKKSQNIMNEIVGHERVKAGEGVQDGQKEGKENVCWWWENTKALIFNGE